MITYIKNNLRKLYLKMAYFKFILRLGYEINHYLFIFILITIIIINYLTSINVCAEIYCWQCDSIETPECWNVKSSPLYNVPNSGGLHYAASALYVRCEPTKKPPYFFCRKNIQILYHGKSVRISRSCGYIKHQTSNIINNDVYATSSYNGSLIMNNNGIIGEINIRNIANMLSY